MMKNTVCIGCVVIKPCINLEEQNIKTDKNNFGKFILLLGQMHNLLLYKRPGSGLILC